MLWRKINPGKSDMHAGANGTIAPGMVREGPSDQMIPEQRNASDEDGNPADTWEQESSGQRDH